MKQAEVKSNIDNINRRVGSLAEGESFFLVNKNSCAVFGVGHSLEEAIGDAQLDLSDYDFEIVAENGARQLNCTYYDLYKGPHNAFDGYDLDYALVDKVQVIEVAPLEDISE